MDSESDRFFLTLPSRSAARRFLLLESGLLWQWKTEAMTLNKRAAVQFASRKMETQADSKQRRWLVTERTRSTCFLARFHNSTDGTFCFNNHSSQRRAVSEDYGQVPLKRDCHYQTRTGYAVYKKTPKKKTPPLHVQNGQDPFLQQPNFFLLLLLLRAVDRQWEKRSSLCWQQHADLCVVLVFAGVFLVAAAAAGAGHAGGAVAQLVAGALYVGTAGAVAFALLAFCITLPGTQWGVPWLITPFPTHPSPPPCLFVSPCQAHGGGVNMTSPPHFPLPLTNSHCLKTSRPYAFIFFQFQTACGSFPCAVRRSTWGWHTLHSHSWD